MKRWTQLVFAAGLALAVSACSGDRAKDANGNSTAAHDGAAGTAGLDGGPGLGDGKFGQSNTAKQEGRASLPAPLDA